MRWFHRITLVAVLLASTLGCMALQTATPVPTVERPAPTPLSDAPLPTVMPEQPAPSIVDLEEQVAAVYQAVSPSVVNIAVTTLSYDFFFNPVPREGSGSGFVYDDEGHIITNYHVVEGASEIQVIFADGVTVPGEVVGQDPTYDLAVVKIAPGAHSLRPVSMGDSGGLRVGQFVVAIGNPFGLEQTMTFGVISSLGRVIESPDRKYIGEAIQTDAAINPGNSGGPLLDLAGRVIGVNAQIVSPSRANAGIGFAIPADAVKRVVPELIAYGRYRHPWMGVSYFPAGMSEELATWFAELGAEVEDRGVLLLRVEPGSPADRAGLRGGDRVVRSRYGDIPVGGDVIVGIDDATIETPREMIAYLETYTRPGDAITVTVMRDGSEKTLNLTLGEKPE